MGERHNEDPILKHLVYHCVRESMKQYPPGATLEWGPEERILVDEVEGPCEVSIERTGKSHRLSFVVLNRL
jgi:hypothetical protein